MGTSFPRHRLFKNVDAMSTGGGLKPTSTPPPAFSHSIRLSLGGSLSSVARLRFTGHGSRYRKPCFRSTVIAFSVAAFLNSSCLANSHCEVRKIRMNRFFLLRSSLLLRCCHFSPQRVELAFQPACAARRFRVPRSSRRAQGPACYKALCLPTYGRRGKNPGRAPALHKLATPRLGYRGPATACLKP